MPLDRKHTLIFTIMKIVGLVMVLAGASLIYNTHLGGYIGLDDSVTKILGGVLGILGLFDLFVMPKVLKLYWKKQDEDEKES